VNHEKEKLKLPGYNVERNLRSKVLDARIFSRLHWKKWSDGALE